MRRKDREITNIERIEEIINRCKYCRLGFYDDGEIYIVPLNFGYKRVEEKITLYFHGAKEGRKISLIKKSNNIGFEMDCNQSLKEGENACSYSTRYESIIGNGKVYIVEDKDEKNIAFQAIMYQSTKKRDWQIDEARINATTIFKVEVSNMTCKIHE